MSNNYYSASGNPGTGAPGASLPMRTEFSNLQAAFDKLPGLSGNANLAVVVNGGGTGLTVTTGQLALAANLTLNGGAVTFGGSFTTTWTATANVTLTLPAANGTLATLAGTETLTNKTLGSSTVGTTQAFEDNSTKLATTAYVDIAIPAGVVLPYAGSSAPTGYLLCDGSAVSRTTYAALFALVGTTYGAGNGSTTFNVPDMRGRVAAGVDGGVGRLGIAGLGQTAILAANGGAQTISPNITVSGSATTGGPSSTQGAAAGAGFNAADANHGHNVAVSSNGANTLSVVQPTLVLNFIIKT